MEDGLFQTLHLPPPPSLSKLVFPQVESLSQLEQRAEKKTHFLCEFADQPSFSRYMSIPLPADETPG